MNLSDKLVFKPVQIKETRDKVQLKLEEISVPEGKPKGLPEGEEPTSAKEEVWFLERYRNEKLEQIDAELKEYRTKREEELEYELKEVKDSLEAAREEAKSVAFDIIQEAKEKSKREQEAVSLEANKSVEQAKLEVERMIKEAEMKVFEVEEAARQKGFGAGQEAGFKEGEAEVKRLIDYLASMIGKAAELREKLIIESEKQIVEMVLMIARKVIKDEIIDRKEIVLNNIRQALTRIKDHDSITIRVNFADLELTTAHKDELVKTMETLPKVNVYEDSRVERGGCIIETRAGAIDARISTQLKQIEEAVRNTEPL